MKKNDLLLKKFESKEIEKVQLRSVIGGSSKLTDQWICTQIDAGSDDFPAKDLPEEE